MTPQDARGARDAQREAARMRRLADDLAELALLLGGLMGGRGEVETAITQLRLARPDVERRLAGTGTALGPAGFAAAAAARAARERTLASGGDAGLAACRAISEGRAVLLRARRDEIDRLHDEIAACPAPHPSRTRA